MAANDKTAADETAVPAVAPVTEAPSEVIQKVEVVNSALIPMPPKVGMDETQPGGCYKVDGKYVDAYGAETRPQS